MKRKHVLIVKEGIIKSFCPKRVAEYKPKIRPYGFGVRSSRPECRLILTKMIGNIRILRLIELNMEASRPKGSVISKVLCARHSVVSIPVVSIHEHTNRSVPSNPKNDSSFSKTSTQNHTT